MCPGRLSVTGGLQLHMCWVANEETCGLDTALALGYGPSCAAEFLLEKCLVGFLKQPAPQGEAQPNGDSSGSK